MSRQIGTLGTIDTIAAGNRLITDLGSNLIILGATNGASTHFTTLRTTNGSSGYQVPGGKSLKIIGYDSSVAVGAAAGGLGILYGDTDVGLDSASAPTNPIYQNANGSASTILLAVSAGFFGAAVNFTIPTGKYPAVVCAGTIAIYVNIYGYLI